MHGDKPSFTPPLEPAIQQTVTGDRNQTIGQVLDSIVVYGQVILNAPLGEPAKREFDGLGGPKKGWGCRF